MATSDLIVSQPFAGTMVVTLNRPQQRNALSASIVEELLDALAEASATGVRLLVLRGSGATFCAGFDLSTINDESDGDLLLRFVRIEALLHRIYSAPFATIALAHGNAVGAGADIFAAGDRRFIMGDARLAFPGAAFGLLLGTRRLIDRVGPDRTQEIVRAGRVIEGQEALAIGLATGRISEAEVDSLIALERRNAEQLDGETTSGLRAVQAGDGAMDLVHVVRSAMRPGLKERIQGYRDRSQ